jgi:HEAT repeat protein
MRDMLIEYMGNGFLENIVALLKQDSTLYRFIADMLGTDNIRVRLGATALVEDLVAERRSEIRQAVPGIIALLKHDSPTIRGDAASVLGIIRDRSAIEALKLCLHDGNPGVREVAGEALQEIEG